MSRLKSNLLTAGIGLGVLVLLVGVFLFMPLRSGNVVQVAFFAYTNDLVLGDTAIFCVTNSCNVSVTYDYGTAQFKNDDKWTDFRVYIYGNPLPPHGTAIFNVPATSNGVVWREPVLWHYDQPTPIESFRGKLKGNLFWNYENLLSKEWPWYYKNGMRDNHLAYSPELTNEPAASAAQPSVRGN